MSEVRPSGPGSQGVGLSSSGHERFRLEDAPANAEIRAEVLDAATVNRRAGHLDPAPSVRFPYGDRYSRTIDVRNQE